MIKDVVSKFKVSLKGKPRLWFEMQYPTSADEPKTKEAYEKMIASFITEHNTIGSTITDSQDSRNVSRNSDDIKIPGFQFKGKIDYLDDCVTKIVEMFEKNNKRLIDEIKGSRDNRDSRDSRSSRDSSRRGHRSDSDSSSEDDRYRSRSRDESRSRSRSRGRSGKPCTYCHKPNHEFSHCYKLARELRKLCTGEKRNKGDKEEEARLNMLSCVKNYFESEKDSTN